MIDLIAYNWEILAGAVYLGIEGEGEDALIYFNDPKTGSTLGIAPKDATVPDVEKKMEISRKRFGDEVLARAGIAVTTEDEEAAHV